MKKSIFALATVCASLLMLPVRVLGLENNGTNATITTNSLSSSGTTVLETAQNAEDQFRLGRAYARGEGVAQSYERAGEWYMKAADQGNLKAMNNLGILFLEGQGTKKDPVEAYRWFCKASDLGDSHSSYLRGLLLCEGRGVKPDPSQGLAWIEKASSMGNPAATARLAHANYFGEFGLKEDRAKALPLLRTAATAGDPWACLALGQMYLRGQEVAKDDATAITWFKKGAEGGNPDAIFEYGSAILKTNSVAAYPWLKCAILRNATISNTKGILMECRRSLTEEEALKGDNDATKLDATLPQNSAH
jgi:TPR repeat protein